jgi:GT2 family glycosyltransferase
MIRLIEWTHDPELSIHLKAPIGLIPHDSARNFCVKEFLEDYYDYLLFIDNDIVPPSNALIELLNADKDIIAPLCFSWQPDDKGLGFPMPVALRYNDKKEYKPYYGQGIEETDAITGGMFLAKREVYEKMDRPFAFTYHANGIVIYSEDFYFSQQAQKLGYKLYTHYGLICKHYKNIDIREVNELMVKYG